MNENFKTALFLVLAHEGSYVNDPKDPGGPTNRGVTLRTYRAYVNPKAHVKDLKKITSDEIAMVYRRHYWDEVVGAELPSGLDYAMFDFAVNSGPGRATKFLQKIVGATVDGKIGPETLSLLGREDFVTLVNRLCDARLAFLKRQSTWKRFGKGWTRRVVNVRERALDMVTE